LFAVNTVRDLPLIVHIFYCGADASWWGEQLV
jgi:hypothetical protein